MSNAKNTDLFIHTTLWETREAQSKGTAFLAKVATGYLSQDPKIDEAEAQSTLDASSKFVAISLMLLVSSVNTPICNGRFHLCLHIASRHHASSVD